MGDLTEMRAAAAARLAQAELESSVLDRIAVFGADLDSIGVTFEVLQLDTEQIEISIVIGGLGNPAVHTACTTGASPAPLELDFSSFAEFRRRALEMGEVLASVGPKDPAIGHAAPESAKADPAVEEPAPAVAKPKKAAREYVTGSWSDDEIATALNGIKADLSNGQIAAKLGRHAGSCNMFLAKLRGEIDGTAASAKRKLVPGKDRVKKAAAHKVPATKLEAAKPAPAVQAKPEKPVVSVPFSKRAAPDTPDVPANAARVERPYAERAIIAHLDAVGYAEGWNAERDFELVEEICRGSNLAVVATELHIGFAAAQARWRQLNTHIGDTDHQARLVRILKERADV